MPLPKFSYGQKFNDFLRIEKQKVYLVYFTQKNIDNATQRHLLHGL